MPTSPGILIVGASQAGLQLATSLRELGHQGALTLLGGESRPPYQRPPLSKAYLQGKLSQDGLALRGADYYAKNDIDLVCGEWIESVRLSDPESGDGVAVAVGGRELRFDRLALAVGGSPRRMRVPGAELAGIHYVRDVEDADRLREDLTRARRVVVVGGGFVGLEAAAAATAAGKDVTVVEAADRLLARAVSPETSAFYIAAHERRGTRVLTGAVVTRFEGQARVEGVVLDDGRVIPADVVVVGIGLVPHTELAEALGLEVAGGIVVDQAGRTSNPAIVAAGDCTVTVRHQGQYLGVESVQNAISQAKTAAATLLGVPAPPAGVPWFWSDQADLKLQIAGLNIGYDATILRGDPATESFSVLYYRAGRFISIDAINAPRDYMAARKILEIGGDIPMAAAADAAIALKKFLALTA